MTNIANNIKNYIINRKYNKNINNLFAKKQMKYLKMN